GFHDVTTGNNRVNNNLGYDAGPGWDFPTGWGSANVYRLLEILVPNVPSGLTPSVVRSSAPLAPRLARALRRRRAWCTCRWCSIPRLTASDRERRLEWHRYESPPFIW
ncbi:MAG TPA: hypothetical protein VKT80_10725, partial [Chloroflexota bacterium]|nr:hypothetical protein [Chloroflexota bacterium]